MILLSDWGAMASRFGGFGLVFKKHMLQSHGGVQLGAQSLAPLISKRLFSDDSKKVEYTSEYFSRVAKIARSYAFRIHAYMYFLFSLS